MIDKDELSFKEAIAMGDVVKAINRYAKLDSPEYEQSIEKPKKSYKKRSKQNGDFEKTVQKIRELRKDGMSNKDISKKFGKYPSWANNQLMYAKKKGI